jgi:heme-degrading monooxygenase HmoA
MFLYQETYYVTPGLQRLIEARVRSLHENHATNPAFRAGDWMKYLGNDTTYMALRLWHDRDVEPNEQQLAFMAEYNRARPADAFIQSPDIELFEPILQAGSFGDAAFLVRADSEVGGRSTQQWEHWEGELREQISARPGFREVRLYRFLGSENRYVRAEFWDSAAAAREFWTDPGTRDLMAALPATAYRMQPKFAYYEVLHQLGDPRIV